jgi:hypothetical protein
VGDNESRTKRMPGASRPDRRRSGSGRLMGERRVVELAGVGEPLGRILNRLCSEIDFKIGNVVSLVSLPGQREGHFWSIAQSAVQFGLSPFSSTDIFSRDRKLLGTLQIYCCDRRRPTRDEFQLIERVIRLVATALERHNDAADPETSSRDQRIANGGGSSGKRPFIN